LGLLNIHSTDWQKSTMEKFMLNQTHQKQDLLSTPRVKNPSGQEIGPMNTRVNYAKADVPKNSRIQKTENQPD
jgi:hypothetical protein